MFFSMPVCAAVITTTTAVLQGTDVVLNMGISTLDMPNRYTKRFSYQMAVPSANYDRLSRLRGCHIQRQSSWTRGVPIASSDSVVCPRYLFSQGDVTIAAHASVRFFSPFSFINDSATVVLTIDNTPVLSGVMIPAIVQENSLPIRGLVNFVDGGNHGDIVLEVTKQNRVIYRKRIDIQRIINWYGARAKYSGIYDLANLKVPMPSAKWPDGQYLASVTAKAHNGASVSKIINFELKRQPSVSISLDKTKLYDCESVVGSIAVTNPAGQFGVVFLTYPDGSIVSAPFSGAEANLTLADFGLRDGFSAAGLAGSQLNFSATVATVFGGYATSTASAQVLRSEFTAILAVNQAFVEKGSSVAGTLTVSSPSTCPANGISTIGFAGQAQSLPISGIGAIPFTFDTYTTAVG